MAGTRNSGGRNKKSATLHVLQGTFQPSRHEGHGTPEPPKGRPQPPKDLVGEAKAEWDRMIERLELSGTLSLVDDGALYQYAELYAETEGIKADGIVLRKLSADLKAAISGLEGAELVSAVGEIVKIQIVLAKQTQQLRQGHMGLRQWLVEFGMTPSARSRVKLPSEKKAVDPIEARFFGSG